MLVNRILNIFEIDITSILHSLISRLYLIKRQGDSIAEVFGFIENLGVDYTVCLGGKSILFLHIIYS
jgi:hypothetical protein